MRAEERVRELLAGGGRGVLGIAGPPGSGKSTLAQRLAQAVGADAVVVPMDGFHLATSELKRLGRMDRQGAPDTFDATGYVALLRRLRQQLADEVVYAPEFRRDGGESVAGAIAVEAKVPLVITEGNYLLLDEGPWAGVRPLLDEVWYVDVDDALRRERLAARHVSFGRTQAQARAWMEHTDEPNARRIAGYRHRAHFAVELDASDSRLVIPANAGNHSTDPR